MSDGRLTMGLDVARVRDDSALAVVEEWRSRQVLVHLTTWKPTREDCADAVLPVVGWLERHADGTGGSRPRIAIDGRNRQGESVVSAAVAGELGRRADVFALLPSHSDRPHFQRPDGWIYVGKDPLVSLLGRAMAAGDLLVAHGLPEADAFRRELLRLARVTTRRGTGTTWSHPDQRKDSHDDRVMAAAYAYWLAHTFTTQGQAVLPLRRAA